MILCLSFMMITMMAVIVLHPLLLIKLIMHMDHDKNALCDSYIVELVHDATGNYYERGKYGFRNFHGTKTPLYMLKLLKLFLFYLTMLVTLFFLNLFVYK